MKIGVIRPIEREIMPFISKILNKKLSEHAMLTFHSGLYQGVDVVAVICGALNRQLEIGDIVISSELAYHDVAHGILTEYHPWMEDIYIRPDVELLKLCENISKSLSIKSKCYIGRIITGESFITHNERESLIEKFNPLCVDMESASIAHTCYVNNIPFIVIRAISDGADKNGSTAIENNMEIVALNSIKFVEELIKKLSVSKNS